LLKALLTGDKSGLDSHTVATFRDSGAAHILALSGLHLGFIYAILLKVTSLAGMSPRVRKIRSILIIAVSGFYTIATGASPSLVRAFLFIVINETARLLHRHVPPVHVLCIALMIQLALTPAVISSIGFQMSYLAMAGIFLIYPHLKAWYPGRESGIDLPRKIWNTAALTLSCQILTGPLAWLRFRTFPLYFLITNLFALPVTSLLMLLAICTTALTYIGLCPNLLVTATDSAASALLFIMEVIAGL
uniref:ComEC/Rec2 family competence protein n=1 Tax=Candidatus Cryptobacteroides bacterium TaxID=3085639 RepID=UPI004029B283